MILLLLDDLKLPIKIQFENNLVWFALFVEISSLSDCTKFRSGRASDERYPVIPVTPDVRKPDTPNNS